MWCGLFVNHVFMVSNVQHGVKGAALAANWSIPKKAIIYRWGVAISNRRPMSGDVALFRFGGKRIDHVEIVISWPEETNYFWVIGGNTSNPSNPKQEGVYAKQRLKSQSLIVNRIDYFN